MATEDWKELQSRIGMIPVREELHSRLEDTGERGTPLVPLREELHSRIVGYLSWKQHISGLVAGWPWKRQAGNNLPAYLA